jgi:parallel beta-helix repeat protein
MNFRSVAVAVACGGVLGAVALPGVSVALPASATSYVSPTGSGGNDGTSCAQATFATITAAVTAAPAGGTVIVCAGIYPESVTLSKSLSLISQGAVINAAGKPYGIGIAADNSTVTGFTVRNAHADAATQAPGDGIVTAGLGGTGLVSSNDDVISQNTTVNNDGSGIDMESTSYSTVSDNVSRHNGIGINIVNDIGAASSHNHVSGNLTSNNPGGCGIVLADHTGSGIFDNDIVGNTARNNGLGSPTAEKASSGSGIILAAAAKGGVYNNLLQGNTLTGNGHGGVALHGHAKGPKFTGNQIIGNTIGKNNRWTDYKDKKPTGVYLGDKAALSIVVRNNLFTHDQYAVFTAGPVKVSGMKTNGYVHVKKHLKHIKKYAG